MGFAPSGRVGIDWGTAVGVSVGEGGRDGSTEGSVRESQAANKRIRSIMEQKMIRIRIEVLSVHNINDSLGFQTRLPQPVIHMLLLKAQQDGQMEVL